MALTQVDQGLLGTYAQYTGFKNRLINGQMQIDQRNAGASVTAPINGSFSVDRWQLWSSQASKYTIQQNAGSITPPVGFSKYMGVTSSSAYTVGASEAFQLRQQVEGYNVADLAFGTANAKTVTLSFWVYSSLTGTFGGAALNGSFNRSYPFSYTINAANTWEQKSITIVGDTSGTWATDNSTGFVVNFSLGTGSTYATTAGAWASGLYLSATGAQSVVGTNGATFYITGVQLEKGSTATSFDYRPYGTELALCQRYYWTTTKSTYNGFAAGLAVSTTQANVWVQHPVSMRDVPTYGYSGTIAIHVVGAGITITSIIGSYAGLTSGRVDFGVASGLTAGQGSLVYSNNGASNYFYASAEL